MRIFIERFILAILAALVLFIVTTPMQISWWPTRIVSIIGIVIIAGIAAYLTGWNEWRWERIRAVWWLWSIFGTSAGALPSVSGYLLSSLARHNKLRILI